MYHWKFRVPVLKIHSLLDCGILLVVNKLCEVQKIYNASYTSKYQLKEKSVKREAHIADKEEP